MRALPVAMAYLTMIACGAATPSLANDIAWPERPVKLIVPFQPGSSSDVIGRIVANYLGPQLKSSITVENRVGGSTIIGTTLIARAEPDGYTIGLANTSTHAATYASGAAIPFDPINDFIPVAMIGSSPFLLLGSPKLPARTMKELIAHAKQNPGKLNYASAGSATLSHLAGELFQKLADVKVVHVPYRGTSTSVYDVLEGRMDLLIGVVNSTQDFIRNGQIVAFAALAPKRVPAIPDVPTAAEAGLPGCEADLWTAIVLPAGVPKPIVDKLNRELNVVITSEEVQTLLRKQGVEPEPGSPEVVAQRVKADIDRWRTLIETQKIGKN